MMNVLTAGFAGTVQWVLQHGYFFLFLLMLIEGPVITAAGAFAAALNYLDIWVVLALSILANLIPDLVFYAIGYWSRARLLNRYGHYFGLTPGRIASIERLAEQHSGKSIFMIKMVPFISAPGLILVGATRMTIRKFVLYSLIVTIPSSLFYLILGYYFGDAYTTVDHYLHIGGYIIIAAIVIIVVIAYIQRKYFSKLSEDIDKKQ